MRVKRLLYYKDVTRSSLLTQLSTLILPEAILGLVSSWISDMMLESTNKAFSKSFGLEGRPQGGAN